MLALSLALNGFLLVLIVSDRPIEPQSVPIREPTVPGSDAIADDLVTLEEAVEPSVFQWSDLVAEDLREYATNLEEMGCRADVVRAVLADEIRRRYLPLFRQLRRESAGDYWERSVLVKTSRRGEHERNPEVRAAEERLNAMFREYAELQREFGIEDERDRFPDFDDDDVRVSFLSEEKRVRLREQEQAVDQLRRKLRSEGVPEEQVRQQARDMEAAQDLERREFLEPNEYEEYTLRRSPHAGLIGSLYGFEPTPEERDAILRWRESAGDEVTNEDWERGLRPLLGDARFAQLERGRDSDYRDLVEMTAHLGMEEYVANEVYATRQAAANAEAAIRALESLEPERQFEALAELRAATEQAVRAELGEEAFGVYMRHADWLKGLDVEWAGP